MGKKETEELYLGVDVGNGYTKSRKIKFASRVEIGGVVGFKKLKKNTYAVKYEGQEYVVGQGASFIGDTRYFETSYRVCLLTAIALNFPKNDFIEVAACVGLPVENFKILADKLIETYKGTQHEITIGDRTVTIRFKEFDVYVEGAYPVFTGDEEGNYITIDMGAGTINVTEFIDGILGDYATYPNSLNKLYGELSKYLNEEKGGKFDPSDIEPLLNKKTTTIKQKEVDITDIRPRIQKHINAIASNIKSMFNVEAAKKIYCIGGGCMDTFQYWKEAFKDFELTLIPNGQEVNSQIFDLIACDLVTGDEE